MSKLRFNLSHISAGAIAVLVAYTSSVILVIHALTEMGLTQGQINSWLFTLGLIMGITTIIYSFYFKVPVLTAWSTPGAAFLITAVEGYSATDVVGAFVVCSLWFIDLYYRVNSSVIVSTTTYSVANNLCIIVRGNTTDLFKWSYPTKYTSNDVFAVVYCLYSREAVYTSLFDAADSIGFSRHCALFQYPKYGFNAFGYAKVLLVNTEL